MAATKRNFTEREQDLVKIAKLSRRGYGPAHIGRVIGVSAAQIVYDLKEIHKRYLEEQVHEEKLRVGVLKAQYDDLLIEHWRCYEQEKRDAERVVTTQERRMPRDDKGNPIGPAELVTTEIKTTVEGRVPGSQHLVAIAGILHAIRDLYGLDAPKRIEMKRLTIDFEQLMKEIDKGDTVKVPRVEEQLEQYMKEIPQLPPISQPLPNGIKELGNDHAPE